MHAVVSEVLFNVARRRRLAVAVLCLASAFSYGQNTEILVGQKRATQDVMFFKYFEKPEPQETSSKNSKFLFFFRARATAGYLRSDSAPQFGLTSAISYNPEAWKGFAPVLVGQAFNRGTFAKVGLQYAWVRPQLTLFSWCVTELQKRPTFDLFVLARFLLPLAKSYALFLQVEALSTFPSASESSLSLVQRLRVGIQLYHFQFGPALDLSQTGRSQWTATWNPGVFVRVDF